MEDMTKKFAKALFNRRKQLGLSQEELAQRVGTTKQVVSKYELAQRSPKVEMANAFAEALGTTLDEMLEQGERIIKFDNSVRNRFEVPQTDEVRLLIRGFNKLPKQQQEQALNVFRAMFIQAYPDLFKEE